MGLWLDRGRECDNLHQAIEIQIIHYLCGTDSPVSVALNTPLNARSIGLSRGFFIRFCYPSVTRPPKWRLLVTNKPIYHSELQPILERSNRFCIGKKGCKEYLIYNISIFFWSFVFLRKSRRSLAAINCMLTPILQSYRIIQDPYNTNVSSFVEETISIKSSCRQQTFSVAGCIVSYQFQVLTDLSQHSATKFNRRYFGQILFDGLMVVAVAYKNWLGKYRIIA